MTHFLRAPLNSEHASLNAMKIGTVGLFAFFAGLRQWRRVDGLLEGGAEASSFGFGKIWMARFRSLMLLVALTAFLSATDANAIVSVGNKSGGSLGRNTPLAAGCALACANGYLYIDNNVTLTADTTLNCNLIVAGGVISLNAHKLIVNGSISGDPNMQIIDVGITSSTAQQVTITGGTVLYGAWFTGPYGKSGVDYSPGLQQAYNFVCRINGYTSIRSTPGPRVLDVQSTGDRAVSPGIFLNE